MNNIKKLVVLILSVMMVLTMMPTIAFAAEGDEASTEPVLIGETFWSGTESWSGPVIMNVNENEVEIISWESSDRNVLILEQIGDTDKLGDYILTPVDPGTAVLTITYSVNGVEQAPLSAEYTVKPFPEFITSLTIDGEEQAPEAYKNHNYYDIEGYEGTSTSIQFTVAEGWTFEGAYGFRLKDGEDSEYFSMDKENPEDGWSLDFPEEYVGMNTFYDFRNEEGDSISFGIRISRDSGGSYEPGEDYELPDGSVYVDENGMLCWGDIEGAADFMIWVQGCGYGIDAEDNGSYDINGNLDARIRNGEINKSADDTYNLEFIVFDENSRTIGRKAWDYHYQTDAEYAPPEKLEFSIENGYIEATWPNADEWKIIVFDEEGNRIETWSESYVENLKFDIDAAITSLVRDGSISESETTHHIMVQVLIDNQLAAAGETDYEFTAQGIGQITGFVFNDATGRLSWTKVDRADQYEVHINEWNLETCYDNEIDIYDAIDQCIKKGYIDPAENNIYDITVRAQTKYFVTLSEGTYRIRYDSPATPPVEMIASIDENGILSWDPVDGAVKYKISYAWDDESTTKLSFDLALFANVLNARGRFGDAAPRDVEIEALDSSGELLGSWKSTYEPDLEEIDLIQIDTIEIADINTDLVPGVKPAFTARLLSDHMYIDWEGWNDGQGKVVSATSNELPEEGDTLYHLLMIKPELGYDIADNPTIIYNGKTVEPRVKHYNWGEIHLMNVVPEVTVTGSDTPDYDSPVNLTAASVTKVYDGTPLMDESVTVTGLPEGFTAEAKATGSQTDAGSCPNVVSDDFVIRDAEGKDRTANFTNITKVNGTLTVTKAPLTISTGSATKEYDGTPVTNDGVVIGGLVSGEDITVIATGSQTEVGTSDNTYSITWDKAKAANYEVTAELGTLTVTGKVLTDETVSLAQTVFPYTGSNVDINKYVMYNGETVPNDCLSTNYNNQRPLNIGDYTVTITGVYGGYCGTATENFTIKGDLSGTYGNPTVTLDSAEEYVYAGKPVEPKVASVTFNGKTLKEGTDYTVSYENNNAVGTGYAVITAVKDSYYMGVKKVPFTIAEKESETHISEWVEEDGNTYYYDENGNKAIGWKKVSGKWYYMDAEGVMQTGWTKVSGKWYYMDAEGVMKTGWVKISKKWYYFNSSGVMQTGWKKISGKQYFFKSSGAMAANEWVKGYWWINKDGTWTYKYKASWKKSGSRWWFTDTSGWYAKNTTITIDGKKYTFDKSGWMV